MAHFPDNGLSRRQVLRAGLAGALGLGFAPLMRTSVAAAPNRVEAQSQSALQLRAAAGEVEVAPGQVYRTWLYNGALPGPEIRVKEGEWLRVTVDNQLPAGTTIHWHGVPVPNAMDGVPGLTQEPVSPRQRFLYEFRASPAGSYLYHTHVGLQLDRGLYGPLIVEEATPHVAYDREYSLVLDDYLPAPPVPLDVLLENSGGSAGGMMGPGRMGPGMMGPGMMGPGMMGPDMMGPDMMGPDMMGPDMMGPDMMGPGMMGPGMMGPDMMGPGMMGPGMMGGFVVPPYAGLLINGRLPSAPAEFTVRQGERVRLRLFNPASATSFRVAVGGHRLTVTHADGRPVEPVSVDALIIGMGERYDVVIEANHPGIWPITAATVEGNSPPARALLRYVGVNRKTTDPAAPAQGGRLLQLADLRAVSPLPPGQPDRVFDMILSARSFTEWTINGQVFPEAEPLIIGPGERIRFRLFNRSMMLHPMHLHGHFFQVGSAIKDTVLVPPHMGSVEFDFIADNPGRWLFHCHNLYHLASGMAREVRYA